jgi:hypothetical protein
MTNDIIAIGLEQDQTLTRRALHILRTAAHKMAAMGFTRLDQAIAGHAETLLGPAMGLEFGHFSILTLIYAAGHVQRPSAREGGSIAPGWAKSKLLVGNGGLKEQQRRAGCSPFPVPSLLTIANPDE